MAAYAGVATSEGGRTPGSGEPPKALAAFPDELWLRVLAFLEASELSGSGSLSSSVLALASQPQLWVSLLLSDFCASFAQRALLRTWLLMHQHFHPRQLYIYKRREHLLDLDIARSELHQRGEQAREQDRKHRRLRTLNFFLVRVTHLLLCACLLASSILLWLRLDDALHASYYVVFAPMFGFEVYMVFCAAVAYTVYFLRSASGWTFYWNRLRGPVRWIILYTSACEGAIVLLSLATVVPCLALALEGHALLPWPSLRFLFPFTAFWLASLFFLGSLLRRRSFSASCVGGLVLLWLPLVALSVLLFLRVSVAPHLPAHAVLAPSLGVTSLLFVFVGFLVVASFWLGYRGNRDWTEYATITLLTLLTLLAPLLLFQFSVLGYFSGKVSKDWVFTPLLVWLAGLLACAAWHVFTPSVTAPSVPIDHLTRPWRHQDRESHSDSEMLLPPTSVV